MSFFQDYAVCLYVCVCVCVCVYFSPPDNFEWIYKDFLKVLVKQRYIHTDRQRETGG